MSIYLSIMARMFDGDGKGNAMWTVDREMGAQRRRAHGHWKSTRAGMNARTARQYRQRLWSIDIDVARRVARIGW